MKRHAPATERNREPILQVLQEVLPASRPGARPLVLEIASGTGQHVAFFAQATPWLEWQPTDADPDALPGIQAWADDAGADNIRAPLQLDVLQPWPVSRAAAVLCCNMIHISPWLCTLALLDGAAKVLPVGGVLVTYGPYTRNGEHTAPSNQAFDRSLRQRNPGWGVRDLDMIGQEAARRGLRLEMVVEMPANNLTAVFRRG